jgi:hypothetical protein
MVAPVAGDVGAANDIVGLQLLESGRDVRAGESEAVAYLLGVERPVGEIEQSVDLGDRAVDPPMSPHLPPMEDEGFDLGIAGDVHIRLFL